MRHTYILLGLIFLLALLLRLWQLGQNPPSMTWDEVAWGYNAYALGTDGRDEFGRFLPLNYLESFGDYKPVVYAYIDILPIKLFGLTSFATRFPSAMLGSLTVLVTFFLVRTIFSSAAKKDIYALVSSFVLAISPWHIFLSRAAFEANVSTFFLVTAVWLFLLSIAQRSWWFLLSMLCFVLPIYTFNTGRIVAPALFVILSLAFWRQLLQMKKIYISALLVGCILTLPILSFLLSPQAKLRFTEVNIFSDTTLLTTAGDEKARLENPLLGDIIYNRRIVYTLAFLKHYFDNLSPQFLFITGDPNPKFSLQTVGELYIWDIIFFLSGAFFLFRYREGYWWIVPLWLLLAIIPAATARETPHALRTEATLPTFQILVAYGVVQLYAWLKAQHIAYQLRKSMYIIVMIALGLNVSYFLHDYFVTYPIRYSSSWQYTYIPSIHYVQQMQDKYDRVYVSTTLGRPYIYYVFYNHIYPATFRTTADIQRDSFGFVDVDKVGKYFFANSINELPQPSDQKILYINDYRDVPAGAHVLQRFDNLDHAPSLVAYEIAEK